jgi:hypothetical protein
LVTDDELAQLVDDNPVLFHMAERGSWNSIHKHGLLSTSALLDLFGVCGPDRKLIESCRRPESVTIERKEIGSAVIRDQKPMDDQGLNRCLRDGLTPREWYEILNARVFFWLTRSRVLRLLTARAYKDAEHDVLEIDTAPLVATYQQQITLAPINTGATKPMPAPRGRSTIVSIADYDYAGRLQTHAREPVVELAVTPGVPNIKDFVRRVVVMRGEVEISEVWRRH